MVFVTTGSSTTSGSAAATICHRRGFRTLTRWWSLNPTLTIPGNPHEYVTELGLVSQFELPGNTGLAMRPNYRVANNGVIGEYGSLKFGVLFRNLNDNLVTLWGVKTYCLVVSHLSEFLKSQFRHLENSPSESRCEPWALVAERRRWDVAKILVAELSLLTVTESFQEIPNFDVLIIGGIP